jgi:hypothetical protein
VDVSKILRFHCKTSVAPIITKKLAKPRVSKCMLVGYIVCRGYFNLSKCTFHHFLGLFLGCKVGHGNPLSCGNAMFTCLQSVQLLLLKASSLSNGLQVTDQVRQVILSKDQLV